MTISTTAMAMSPSQSLWSRDYFLIVLAESVAQLVGVAIPLEQGLFFNG